MPAFRTPIDICNRGLQRLGAKRIDPVLGFTEQSKNASECSFAYDKLREAELQRNVWGFAVKRTILRPMNALALQGMPFVTDPTNSAQPVSPTMRIAPALWSSTTSYPAGALVTNIENTIWQSQAPDNLGFAPGNAVSWEKYAGPITSDPYNSGLAYFDGDIVYIAPGDGTYVVYQSLTNNNAIDPSVATAFAADQVYARDEVVTSASVLYQSLVDLNFGNAPASSPTQWSPVITSGSGSVQWRTLQVALQPIVISYPLGTGPCTQSNTQNAYRLPNSFLREAPQNPKPGIGRVGGPVGNYADDYVYDGDYIISSEVAPITYRFVADLTNVMKFHAMFCEGLAARIAYEVCEAITQSTEKQQACATAYAKFMGEARTVNAIEQGPTDPPEDDLIAVRF
jgi:hypothetical protein